MAIDTEDAGYKRWKLDWRRMRHVLSGQSVMREHGADYLRIPIGMTDRGERDRYINAVVFFEATLRTLEGLTGMAFYREPEITVPDSMQAFVDDVTQDGVPLRQFIERVFEEVIGTARVGVLLDYPVKDASIRTRLQEERANRRPTLAMYATEDIFHVRTDKVNGVTKVVEVRLWETETEKVGEWGSRSRRRIRVLLLEPNADGVWAYRQRVFVHGTWTSEDELESSAAENDQPTTVVPADGAADSTAWIEQDGVSPTDSTGRPLTYLPFWIINPTDQSSAIRRPPLLGLGNLNIAHFVTTGQLENALFWSGNPQPYATGVETDEGQSYAVGSSELWLFKDAQTKLDFLTFGADGLGPLEKRLDRYEQQMAIMGARMLSPDQKGVEAAETARIHRQGEVSVLAGVCGSVSRAATDIVRAATEWQTGTADTTSAIKIFTAFYDAVISADDALKFMKLWQAGVLSIDDLIMLLKKGELMPGERTIDEITSANQTSPIQPIMAGLTDNTVGSRNAPEPPAAPTPSSS